MLSAISILKNFFSKYSTYLTLGLSAIVLLFIFTKVEVGSFFEQGPKVANAYGQLPNTCTEDTFYCQNGRNIHKTAGSPVSQSNPDSPFPGAWNESVREGNPGCIYQFVDSGSCAAPAPSQAPASQPPTVNSCTEDTFYCQNNVTYHKTGGSSVSQSNPDSPFPGAWNESVREGNPGCIYQFVNTGQACGTPAPTSTPTLPTPVCDGAAISNPSSVTQGSQITFTINNDASTYVSDSYNGLSNCFGALTTAGTSMTCTADASGSLTHFWRQCSGNINNCTSNTCSASTNWSVLTSTPSPTPTPTPVVCPSGYLYTNVGSSQAVCIPVNPSPTPIPPVQIGGPNVSCPVGTVATLNGGLTVVCVSQNQNSINNNTNIAYGGSATANAYITYANNPTVAGVAYTNPQVVQTAGYTGVKELPKTGVPLVGWALGGFLPLGLKFRRFGKAREQLSTLGIWKDRQFKGLFND